MLLEEISRAYGRRLVDVAHDFHPFQAAVPPRLRVCRVVPEHEAVDCIGENVQLARDPFFPKLRVDPDGPHR